MSHSNSVSSLLLTGSAGFFGRNFLDKSSIDWEKIYAYDRISTENPCRKDAIFNPIIGDLRDPNLGAEFPSDIDVVVHAAAALPVHSPDEIFETDVLATGNLARWAASAGVRHFVHFSSTAVYGPAHRPRIEETAPTRAFDPYNTAKIRGEAQIKEALAGSSTSWTIIRPKAIVGPGRLGLFGHLYEFAASGHRFPVLSGGRSVYQFLHIDDLVTAVDLAAKAGEGADGQTINVASRAKDDIATLFQSVLDAAGHGKKVLSVPGWLAVPPLKAANALGISPLHSRGIQNLVKGSTVSLDRAKSVLGYDPKYDGMAAVADGFEWYRAQLAEREFEYGTGHSQVWKSPLARQVKRII